MKKKNPKRDLELCKSNLGQNNIVMTFFFCIIFLELLIKFMINSPRIYECSNYKIYEFSHYNHKFCD